MDSTQNVFAIVARARKCRIRRENCKMRHRLRITRIPPSAWPYCHADSLTARSKHPISNCHEKLRSGTPPMQRVEGRRHSFEGFRWLASRTMESGAPFLSGRTFVSPLATGRFETGINKVRTHPVKMQRTNNTADRKRITN